MAQLGVQYSINLRAVSNNSPATLLITHWSHFIHLQNAIYSLFEQHSEIMVVLYNAVFLDLTGNRSIRALHQFPSPCGILKRKKTD